VFQVCQCHDLFLHFPDVTQGATKGNSGIVHAGFDDAPGSVRSRFCWPGNQMFPQLDRELHFGLSNSVEFLSQMHR
jgi:L-2-hydroxyglutarate oxidase LhgO